MDNFDTVTDIMEFVDEEDFYFVQILQRRKDGHQGTLPPPEKPTRLIRTYSIRSLDHLFEKKDEIKELCHVFGARAQININKRNFKKCAFEALKETTDSIYRGNYSKVVRSFDTACGRHSAEEKNSKKWILDIDEEHTDESGQLDSTVGRYLKTVNKECMPEGDKFVTVIPSKNGAHVITRPFDVKKFREHHSDVDIQKDAFTNLYIPEFD